MSIAAPAVLADAIPRSTARNVILVIAGACSVGLSAQISIPLWFTPVPLTGQTFAVLLAAASLGMWRSMASMGLYAIAGLAGVPWFAGQATAFKEGALVASFGYILGFIAAAGLVGYLAQRGATRTALRTAGLMVMGNLVIYAIGVSWLKSSIGVSWSTALDYGLTPFLAGDAIKVALAAGLFPLAWRAVDRFTRD
jgi:biotin transport system substrate-specific component